MQRGELHAVPQQHSLATMAPKIGREQARIRWELGAAAVGRQIRAFDPVPGAWSTVDGLEVKLFGPRRVEEPAAAGTAVRAGAELVIGTGDGAVAIAEVQPAGKRRMPAHEWTRGRGVRAGQVFG